MALIPYRTWRPSRLESVGLATTADFRNEINRMIEGMFNRPATVPTWFGMAGPGQWLPAIDISEDPHQLQVRVELPGLDPKGLEIDVTEDRLVIAGEKKQTASKSGNGWSHVESQYGEFSRTIPLPAPIDPEKVTARFENGVLTIDLAKAATSVSRKVLVETL